MREAIFILLVVLLILGLTAFRYRNQLAAVYRFWKVLRSARIQGQGNNAIDESAANKGPLVNCVRCGTWVPESSAIKLQARTYFCSAACVEKTAAG